MIYKIQSEFFYNTCLSRIMDLITVPGGSDKKTVAKGLLDKYIQRTILHINLVCESSKILADHYCENTGVDKETYFRRISNHDSDKLNNEDTIVYYAVACEKKYGTPTTEWDCGTEVMDRWENVEWPKHWERHAHHVPEHFGRKEDGVWRVDTNVDRYALTEMVADWTAMWLELGHKSPKAWLDQEHGKSFVLTGGDLDYVNGCCELVEHSENQIAAIRAKYNLAPPKEDQSTEALSNNKLKVILRKYDGSDKELNYVYQAQILSAQASGDDSWTKDEVKKALAVKGRNAYLLLSDNNVIGACVLTHFDQTKDETPWMPDGYRKAIAIDDFAIFKEYQGKGLGYSSMIAIIEHCFISTDTITLGASPSNTVAVNLYKKLGFKIIKEAKVDGKPFVNMGLKKSEYKKNSNESFSFEKLNPEWSTDVAIKKHATKEDIEDMQSHIKEYLYHGSENLYNYLTPQTRADTTTPIIFFTPFAYIASLFCGHEEHIGKGLYTNKVVRLNGWIDNMNKYDGLDDPAVVVDISHNIKELKDYTVKRTGYVYCVKYSKIANKVYPYNRWSKSQECVYVGEPIKPDKIIKVAQTVKVHYDTKVAQDAGGNAIPVNKQFIRMTYDGIGVYEALKNNMTESEWRQFKRSDAATWLPVPDIPYKHGYLSYFTEKGFDKFMQLTEPYIVKHLDKDKLEIKRYDISSASRHIVYSDKYQIVTDGKESVSNESYFDIAVENLPDKDTAKLIKQSGKELWIATSSLNIDKTVHVDSENTDLTVHYVYTPSFEAEGSDDKPDDKRGKISDADKKKLGEYLYHGTHRDLDIKSLGIHVCKNRANTDIEAPVVYMNRSLAVACLHCVPFMAGHGSKIKDYKEHFVDLDKAISSSDKMTEVEIVHNDPDLKECSGENDGYIYCVKKSECVNDLYYATPDKPNDWNFVAYKQLPIAKKMHIKVKWHKKYDEEFAKKVKAGYMAVESLEASAAFENIHHNVEQHIKDNKVYHASPKKLDKLEMSHMGKWYADKKGIFVTPFVQIASCFIIDKQEILDKIQKSGINTHDNPINFKYDVWDKPTISLERQEPPEHIIVTIKGLTGFKEFSGKATGYLYTIDYSKYKDKTSMFLKSQTSDVEFIINDDIIPEKVAKISVDYTVRPGKAVSNEDFLGVGKIYKELSSRKHYDNLFDFMKMQKYTRFAYEATHKKTLRNRNPHNIQDIDLNTVGVIDKYILQTVGKMDHDNLSKEDAVLNCFTHYYDLNVRDMRDREIPFKVERPGISISPQGRNERIRYIKARIDELTKFKLISAHYIQHFKRCLDIHKTTYPTLNIDKFCDQMSSYLPSLKSYFDKWCQFYLKEYQLELKYLQEQKPSVEAFDASKFKPIHINKNPAPDRFANDTMKINRIDPSTLNQDIIKVLEKQDEYLEIVRRWLTVPDYSLTPKLIEFGKFVDKLYGFDKPFTVYRAMRIGKSTLPIQQSMGIVDNTTIIKKPKPFVVPGYKFTYMNTGPLSTTRAVWISKVYGDLIVKTQVRPETSKLMLTNELAYVLQALDEKYPYYRPLNLSALTEVLLFPDQTLNYQVVTTNGDILSEMPEFKAMNFKDKKIELDASMSIGEEQLATELIDTKTVQIGSENLLIGNEKLEIKHDYILEKLEEGEMLTRDKVKTIVQPGDIIIPYPKDKNETTFMKIFHEAERTVYGMSFTSCKMIHDKDTIIGYGVQHGEGKNTKFTKNSIDEFMKHCGGLMILRLKRDIPPTKAKRLHDFMEQFYKHSEQHGYSHWDALMGTLAYVLNMFKGELDPKKLSADDYNKLLCSSVVAAAYRWADLDLGLPKMAISRIMPIHMTMSDKLKCVGYWFARGEWNPTIEKQLAMLETKQGAASTEALSDAAINTKKKQIIDKICKICDLIDPSKINSNRYHRLLDKMTPKEFNQWMTYVKDGKWLLHIVAPNMIVNLRNENLLKAADAAGVKLFHRIWMTDYNTGRTFLTDNEYLVLPLPIRRQQQFLDEKMSVPEDDKHIDGMTGQVTGDSKSTQITTPEINILAFRGLDTTLEEMVNVRGGNMVAYGEFRKQAEETGEIHMNELDPTTRSRTAVIAQVLLNAMHIENNIV